MRFLNNKVTKLVALGIVLGVISSYLLIQLPWLPPAGLEAGVTAPIA